MKQAKVVDLFCGAGGLTYGLEQAGLNVVEGVDVDDQCRYAYETNTKARFVSKDVWDYDANDAWSAWDDATIHILVGCAPCQPFSTYARGPTSPKCHSHRWGLIERFAKLINLTRPNIVSMENVPPLAHTRTFRSFVRGLDSAGYEVAYGVTDCQIYGAPQARRRLVLLASSIGPIKLAKPSHPDSAMWMDVRSAIGHLPALHAGEVDPGDRLHRSSRLSKRNLARIRASTPGGTWRDWPASLVSPCHRRATGRTYPSVYGRMEWNRPAPTITGQCFGFGNGRFGHPEQDRALTLREAALLQTFPREFQFFGFDQPFPGMKPVGRMIGNAVPPVLGRVIGESIIRHLDTMAA